MYVSTERLGLQIKLVLSEPGASMETKSRPKYRNRRQTRVFINKTTKSTNTENH